MALAAGTRLGPYEILEPLGAGGMGEVYRARDADLERDVAIKLLPEGVIIGPERLARFEREAKLLAALNHPGIASIYALQQRDGEPALVLELVVGQTLKDRLKRGALPVPEALDVAHQIAGALEAAHERAIIHRDLKPSNIKLTPEGRVKLLDFGLAKALRPQERASSNITTATPPEGETMSGVVLGTAPYMSPEQARGEELDRRTDIWAFGCVLYELLAGRRAFPGRTRSDGIAAVLTQEPDWEALPEGTPSLIRSLLRRCLRKKKERRVHDIADARIEVEEVLSEPHSDESEGAESSSTAAADSPAASGWQAVLAAATAVVLGAGLATAILWPEAKGKPVPSQVRTLTYSGTDSMPSPSSDGRFVAFVSERDGRNRIWLKQLDTGGEEPLTEGVDISPRFSPDGGSVLFLRADGDRQSLYRRALVGGEARKLADDVAEACWSPDGQMIGILRILSGGELPLFSVGTVDLRTREERELARTDLQLHGLQWSRDGRVLSAGESPLTGMSVGASRLTLFPLDGGEPRRHPIKGPMILGHTWNGAGRQVLYIQAGSSVGDHGDPLSRIVRYDLETGERRTLLHAENLCSNLGQAGRGSILGIPADGKLVFDSVFVRQHLRELEIRDGSVITPGRRLLGGQARDRQPRYSPDGNKILFTSNRTGNLDLWLLDLQNGQLRQVTDDRSQDWDPEFSPDGESILWSSDRSGAFEIWLAEADGSAARQVSHDDRDAENPTMTKDGRWVVHWSANPEKQGIWRIRPNGTDARRIVDGPYLQPDVSRDGRWAALLLQEPHALRSVIHVADVESGRLTPFEIMVPTRFNRADEIELGRMRWMPGSGAIAFIGLDERGRSGIFVQDFDPEGDTTASRRPLAGFDSTLLTESFDISPDGSRVVLSELEITRKLVLAEGVEGVVRPHLPPEGP